MAGNGRTASGTFTVTSVGSLPITLGNVSVLLNVGSSLILANSSCFPEAALPGTWVSVVKPAPLAPRKAVKIAFKNVPVSRSSGHHVLVIDSDCQSSPPIPAGFSSFYLST